MDKKHFDAAASIAGYEEKTGCKASDYLAAEEANQKQPE